LRGSTTQHEEFASSVENGASSFSLGNGKLELSRSGDLQIGITTIVCVAFDKIHRNISGENWGYFIEGSGELESKGIFKRLRTPRLHPNTRWREKEAFQRPEHRHRKRLALSLASQSHHLVHLQSN
jgi:hypothetical protein